MTAPASAAEGTQLPRPQEFKDEVAVSKTKRRIEEYNEKHRGKSLYSEHQRRGPKVQEDDPSARPFDREKDVGGGMKIGHAQRKEMLTRAKDLESRFAGGGFCDR